MQHESAYSVFGSYRSMKSRNVFAYLLCCILVLMPVNTSGTEDPAEEFDPRIAAKKAFTPIGFFAGNPNDPDFDMTSISLRDLFKKRKESIDALLEYRNSPYMSVRNMVISKLGHLDRQDDGKVNDERVVAVIVSFLSDKETQLAVTSLEAIAYLDGSLLTDELIKTIGKHIVNGQRVSAAMAACLAAGELGDARFLPYLHKAIKDPMAEKPFTEEFDQRNADKIRREARKAAARLGDTAASSEIRREILDKNLVKQYNAIMDAAYARDRQAVELIIPFLDKEYGPPNPSIDNMQYVKFDILACNVLDMIVDGKNLRWIDEPTTREKARKRAAVWKQWWGENKDQWLLSPAETKANQ